MTTRMKRFVICQLCSMEVGLDAKGQYLPHRKPVQGRLKECSASGAKPYVEEPGFSIFDHIAKQQGVWRRP